MDSDVDAVRGLLANLDGDARLPALASLLEIIASASPIEEDACLQLVEAFAQAHGLTLEARES